MKKRGKGGKEIIAVSLGGSMIIPKDINIAFLRKFREILNRNTRRFKFAVVCGGGSTAREYIKGLEKEKLDRKRFHQGMLGIAATRLNARFMTYFFGTDANKGIPHDMTEVENMLKKHDIVFCGALRIAKRETSDATSAKMANRFKSIFINLTNVDGLYDKDPRKHKNAKLIRKISWRDFYEMAQAIEYKPGQHFVLDQSASKIIMENKIPTYIIGQDLKELEAVLQNKKFKGTLIEG